MKPKLTLRFRIRDVQNDESTNGDSLALQANDAGSIPTQLFWLSNWLILYYTTCFRLAWSWSRKPSICWSWIASFKRAIASGVNVLVEEILSWNWGLFVFTRKYVTQRDIFLLVQFIMNQDNHSLRYNIVIICSSTVRGAKQWDRQIGDGGQIRKPMK